MIVLEKNTVNIVSVSLGWFNLGSDYFRLTIMEALNNYELSLDLVDFTGNKLIGSVFEITTTDDINMQDLSKGIVFLNEDTRYSYKLYKEYDNSEVIVDEGYLILKK